MKNTKHINELTNKLMKMDELLNTDLPLCCPFCDGEQPHHEVNCTLVCLRSSIKDVLNDLR